MHGQQNKRNTQSLYRVRQLHIACHAAFK